MHVLMMRMEAPLIAFGGVVVDENGVVTRFPGRSLLTGLLANALGWDQSQADDHQRLQSRLSFAARIDREGRPLLDFHTVDLGQPHLANGGWTTRGVAEFREGGPAATGTHIRRRHYHADASIVVALTLRPADEPPTVEELAAALDEPVRPLFLGRKSCVPATYLNAGVIEVESLVDALRMAGSLKEGTNHPALWPVDDPYRPADSRIVSLADDRDWRNQIHAGRRDMREGRISVGAGP